MHNYYVQDKYMSKYTEFIFISYILIFMIFMGSIKHRNLEHKVICKYQNNEFKW